jgi:hypothetical protein
MGGEQEDGGSPDGFHGYDSNGYFRYSYCLYVCVMLETRG